jgi:hypothetical protein
MKNVLDGGAYIEGEHSPGEGNTEQGWESGTVDRPVRKPALKTRNFAISHLK